jgi:hypothetical protein
MTHPTADMVELTGKVAMTVIIVIAMLVILSRNTPHPHVLKYRGETFSYDTPDTYVFIVWFEAPVLPSVFSC